MKAPATKDLAQVKNTDMFSETIEKVKAESQEMKRASFTLTKAHIDYIQMKAVKMTQERGKTVSASAALRVIIEGHSGAVK